MLLPRLAPPPPDRNLLAYCLTTQPSSSSRRCLLPAWPLFRTRFLLGRCRWCRLPPPPCFTPVRFKYTWFLWPVACHVRAPSGRAVASPRRTMGLEQLIGLPFATIMVDTGRISCSPLRTGVVPTWKRMRGKEIETRHDSRWESARERKFLEEVRWFKNSLRFQ